jgi:membrane fusion protein
MRQNQALLEQADAEEGRLQAQKAQSRAEVARARAQFDQRRAEQLAAEGTVVVASRSGRVVALQARPGASALPGQAIAVIVPEGAPLQAELWVPSRAAGFVRVGARVRLMYDSFPYQKFGVGHGRVISVAGAPTNPADLPVPIETREALYRIVVRIDDAAVNGYGKTWALAPGMRLAADMILDERNLWEWLLDPLIAAKRRSES